jgi:hypothetical protein
MTLAPCPNCGGKTTAETLPWPGAVRWFVRCDQQPEGPTSLLWSCGYRGPFAVTLDEAVRKHNKISQNCGAA